VENAARCVVWLAVLGLAGCKSKSAVTDTDGGTGDGGASCGNGAVDDGETCDPPGSCAVCDDGNACTADTTTGSADTCDLVCERSAITACQDGDGCCAAGCTAVTDADCSATCNDGTIDANETCDPQATCVTACNDGNACTTDVLTGSAANCNSVCATLPINVCSGGDGCCPAGCAQATDSDCAPPAAMPLQDRLTVTSVTTPAGVIPGIGNYRIWGSSNLRIGPVFTVPLAGCGTLVGYTTGTVSAPTARVARLDGADQLVTTYNLGAFTLRGLAAEPDGHFAALLWDQTPNPKTLRVTRYDAMGAAGWSTPLADALAAPTDFGIGESRLEYGAGKYGAYFHVHGISGFANGHEGDALHWLDATTGTRTLGWNWGCSHSMSELLRYSPAGAAILPVCVTDCYPGTSGTNFATSAIGGIYINHNTSKVRDVDAGCNGSVAAELGSAAPGVIGWKLVFNTHQNAAVLGSSSYSTSTMNQDIGFTSIANNKTPGPIVWLTTTTTNEANSSIARWTPSDDSAEQYVVGWSVIGPSPAYKLARVTPAGAFLEGPTTITTAKWGERDDPFRTHVNGDIVWAWFDTAGATTLKVARLRSGNTCP